MALDPLEKEHLRQKMANKMGIFLEGGNSVQCVSGHYYEEARPCELCQMTHAHELVVIKNRAFKKMHVAVTCLKEMIRFKVCDAEDLVRWLDKMKDLKVEAERRRAESEVQRQEERKRLEKKVIVRKRTLVEGS